MSNKKGSIVTRFFTLVFVIVGALMLYIGTSKIIKAKDSSDWPTAKGVVLESSVDQHTSRNSAGGYNITHHAEILYEFTVDGTAFSGHRVAYGDYGTSNPSHAKRIVSQYPKGKAVTVYYLHENPKVCLLEPGLKIQALFLPAIGLIFLTIGILITFLFSRLKTKPVV